jgi:nucleoside phosphorylase
VANFSQIDTIFVPQGAEYQAVCRGLNRVTGAKPNVVAVPIGITPLRQYLEKFAHHSQQRWLMMGLCGSLNHKYGVGDVVLAKNCLYQRKEADCDAKLTADIKSQLGEHVSIVQSLTSDRLIWSAAEKQHVGQATGADVVDMEGFAALEFFQPRGVAVAILRVVSDDCDHDIPNLTTAINSDGSLQPLSLTWEFIRQPLAATRLIRGSLQGLKVLQQITENLCVTKNGQSC